MSADCRAVFKKHWNRIAYHLKSHTMSQLSYSNLTLGFLESSVPPSPFSSSSPTASACVLTDTIQRHRDKDDKFLLVRLRPFQHFECLRQSSGAATHIYTFGPTPFARLLQLIGIQANLRPPALLERLHFDHVSATLVVVARTGYPLCTADTASCGPSALDALQFFNELLPNVGGHAADEWRKRQVLAGSSEADSRLIRDRNTCDSTVKRLLCSPINRWLKLQCRPLLDPVTFPQLASLTAGCCLEPLYQYVLCATEGGAELEDEKRQAFEESFGKVVGHRDAVSHLA